MIILIMNYNIKPCIVLSVLNKTTRLHARVYKNYYLIRGLQLLSKAHKKSETAPANQFLSHLLKRVVLYVRLSLVMTVDLSMKMDLPAVRH